MRRYWLDPNEGDAVDHAEVGGIVRLAGDTLHHIRDVCRQGIGDRFEVLVDGRAYFVELQQETKRESVGRILEIRDIEPLPFPRVRLALAIPRFPVFEAVLEKCVELGVEAIQPLFTEQSFIRTQSDTWSSKQVRFQKIIKGATQQCGRGERMELLEPTKLAPFLSDLTADANRGAQVGGLFAYEGSRDVPSRPIRESLELVKAKEPRAVWVFVGGEGGFSRSEVQAFTAVGMEPTTLGQQVLRVETACVALVSILKYEWDLMR